MIGRFVLGLRATAFYAGYFLALAPHATLCILFGWLMPFKMRFRYFVLWNAFALWWLRVTCNVRCRVIGAENIPAEPCVLLANHQSPWETLFLYHFFQPVCAILKKELLRIPFFGWALGLLKPIAIDRSKRTQARQILLAQGKERLQDGIFVLVFPEGTRVQVGQVKKFSSGGAELAITAGVPVLPVAHNAGRFWPAHGYLKFPGAVDLVIGAPISSAGREPRELTEEVEAWIRQAVR